MGGVGAILRVEAITSKFLTTLHGHFSANYYQNDFKFFGDGYWNIVITKLHSNSLYMTWFLFNKLLKIENIHCVLLSGPISTCKMRNFE